MVCRPEDRRRDKPLSAYGQRKKRTGHHGQSALHCALILFDGAQRRSTTRFSAIAREAQLMQHPGHETGRHAVVAVLGHAEIGEHVAVEGLQRLCGERALAAGIGLAAGGENGSLVVEPHGITLMCRELRLQPSSVRPSF